MTEKEKQILDRFATIIPELSEPAKENLLQYGEGMVHMLELLRNKNEPTAKTA